MEYQMRYGLYERGKKVIDPDFTTKIDANSNKEAIQKAKDYIKNSNRRIRRDGDKRVWKLIGVAKIKIVKVMVDQEMFIPLSIPK